MTFPFGLLVGLVAGTGRMPPRAKANLVGTRYVLEVPDEPTSPRIAIAVTLAAQAALVGVLVFSELENQHNAVDVLGVGAFLLSSFIAVLVVPPLRWVAFDERAIHAYAPWRRRPLIVRYSDIVAVRKSLFRKRYVVRTSSKQKLRLHGTWHGFATLARLLLENVPESARMNRRTRMALVDLAQIDAS